MCNLVRNSWNVDVSIVGNHEYVYCRRILRDVVAWPYVSINLFGATFHRHCGPISSVYIPTFLFHLRRNSYILYRSFTCTSLA